MDIQGKAVIHYHIFVKEEGEEDKKEEAYSSASSPPSSFFFQQICDCGSTALPWISS